MQKIIMGMIVVTLSACASTQKSDAPRVELVTVTDDPFLTDKDTKYGEMFRVLILDKSYIVRQLNGETEIQKKKDDAGDQEQFTRFQDLAARYDFKDWEFSGMLTVRIHPHRGEIERIEYVPGQNPKTWQASKLFQEDVSRFAFTFPRGMITTREFRVRYKWRIKRRPGLTEEDARKRAVEFLKAEKQEY
ncbi:MAG: hypothetical protein K8S54_19655 [Spirochaetia bacterium]|nr:hypothetical protein [Spirochaetia bacterium]